MASNYPYKAFPLSEPDPITKQDIAWRPVLQVVLFYKHNRTAPVESIVDTGADKTIFDVQLARRLGIPVEKGIRHDLSGIVMGASVPGYIHRVRLLLAGETFETSVVFAEKLPVAGILGQVGFFDHFTVTFDWTPDPPCFEVHRIQRN